MSANTLSNFLLARIGEDEAAARAVRGSADWHQGPHEGDGDDETLLTWQPEYHTPYGEDRRWHGYTLPVEHVGHIARHDPARVLADCAAKRAIVEACRLAEAGDLGELWNAAYAEGLHDAVELLASAYRTHAEFDPAWAVD